MKKHIKIFCLLFVFGLIFPQNSYANSYNREEAASYALKWYDGYNTQQYYNAGLDCTNFVSQCLEAGGLRRTNSVGSWENLNQWRPHSGTWENANLFSKYWSRFSRRYSYNKDRSSPYYINMSLYNNLNKGDVIQYGYSADDIRHSQIIHNFGVIWNSEKMDTAFLAQHTEGKAWISLYDYLQKTHYTYVVGLGIPSYHNNARTFEFSENPYENKLTIQKAEKNLSYREEFVSLINTIKALVSDFENDENMPAEIYNKNIHRYENLNVLLENFDSLDIESLSDEEVINYYDELRYRFKSV